MIRVDRDETGAVLTCKRAPGPARVVRLRDSDWDGVGIELEKVSFWSLPSEGRVRFHDGTSWVLEARVRGRYHVVERSEGAEIRSAGLRMLALSGHAPEVIEARGGGRTERR